MGGPERAEDGAAAAVAAEQVRTLYRQSAWILAINPVNAAIVGAVLWQPARGALIAAWIALTAVVAVARAVVRRRYFTDEAPADRRWSRRLVLGAGTSGVLWGLGFLVLHSPGDHASEMVLIFVIAGMTAGAAGALAYRLPVFFAFVVPALLPLALVMLLEGGRLHVAMGVLSILYGGVLAITASNSNRAISDAFRLAFENDRLLARLSGTRRDLEEVNRTLERRVEERSAALKRQDEELQEARRMESIGLLAGGVAHDFNNLLTVILGNTVVLQESPALARQADGPLGDIRTAAERAATLVSQLLATSRRQARRPRALDLNAVVSEAHKLLARLIGEHIELVVRLRPAPVAVEADPAQLEQVILNLATNARDAMAGGGRLTLETDVVEVGPGGAPGAATLAPGAWAVLAVRDTGVGMDAETRRLAFHPFFTTKEVGHGTGLGLATVNGIVEQSGGHVFIDSAPGKGSCFRVFLPRVLAKVSAAESETGAAAARVARPATVLLVEDEALVRDVISRGLDAAGLTVLEAQDGEQALARADAHEGAIDLLVTDVVMARMGGPELARRLAAARPGLRVLYISGYGRQAELPEADLAAGVDYLQKPFSSRAVVDRAARLLAAAPPAPAALTSAPAFGPSSRGR
jgi:signal transduction histidine kinase/ActR/RegA family two-component response regulator